MSDTRVPITDAFDYTDQLESREVELTPEQLSWLKEKAEERGVSIDHMLRTILTAQMEDAEEVPPPSPHSGDGAPQSTTDSSSNPTDPSESDTDTPSLVESLRSASERLDDLTENGEDEDEDSTHDLHDTLSRLKVHIDNATDEDANAEDDDPGTVLMDNTNQSMFDMVD